MMFKKSSIIVASDVVKSTTSQSQM